jgi:hypothetical protein
VVGEKQRLVVGVEAQRGQVRAPDALHHEVDVRAHAFHQVEVDEHEEDVVVAGREVGSGRDGLQELAAEVHHEHRVTSVVHIVWGRNTTEQGVILDPKHKITVYTEAVEDSRATKLEPYGGGRGEDGR